MPIYESGDRIEYGPTSYEKAVIEDHRDELERTIAASRALVELVREEIICLLDITRVVYANHYGNPGFAEEAFVRNLRAEQTLALTESDILKRLEEK